MYVIIQGEFRLQLRSGGLGFAEFRKEKKRHAETYLFWWARRDLNPHVRSEH